MSGRTRLALRLEEEIKQRAKGNQGARTDILSNRIESQAAINTQQELAKLAGVGSGTTTRDLLQHELQHEEKGKKKATYKSM